MKWSEFKERVEKKLNGKDLEIDFMLFDIDYNPDKLWIVVNSRNRLWVEG